MNHSQLDNVMWHAMSGPHRAIAGSLGDVRWYPSTVAPFIAVRTARTVPDLDGATERGFAAPAYFVGVLPDALPAAWHFVARSTILQMLPALPSDSPRADPPRADSPRADPPRFDAPPSGAADIRELGTADRPSMLALARIAFPDYFRARTAELGLYLGIFENTKLVAMAGERLALQGLQEISGVCTHPDFTGRGYARCLTQALMRRHRQRGVGSFLHVSEGNVAARRLYESMGFAVRAGLPMGKVERGTPAAARKAPDAGRRVLGETLS